VFAVGLGQGADRLGDDRVDGRQLLIDYPLPVGGEVNQDLTPVRGMGAAFDQTAAFEGVGQRRHAGVRQLFEMFHSAFDQARVEVDDMIAEGDKVFVLARMTGTQRGEFMGIAATGNTIDVSICDYFRVGNGALVEHWGVMDAAGMMQQLTAH
jgi:predicted ester cyclase